MQRHIASRVAALVTRRAHTPTRRLCAAAGAPTDASKPTATSPPPKMSPRVATLLDDLVSLNMLEVKSLTDGLKDRLGIDDSAAMPMAFNPAMLAGLSGGAPADAADAKKPVEKTHFDLKLEKFDAGKKIAVIKEIRAITGLGLKESKALVEDSPKVFKNEIPKDEAEKIRDKLKEIGAEVILE